LSVSVITRLFVMNVTLERETPSENGVCPRFPSLDLS
jgi:hypothetical protein